MTDPTDDPQALWLTIGALSQATGVPAATLRTWERRYDFPRPARTAGGQRLYDPALIAHIELAARALERGHRPQQILVAPLEQLRRIVQGDRPAVPSAAVHGVPPDWWAAILRLDGVALDASWRAEWALHGGLHFAIQRAVPLLRAIGDGWAAGELDIYVEHFASERLGAFLEAAWRPLSDRATGRIAVLTTLPGERHELGLQLSAAILALHGWRVVFLGVETPVAEISRAAARVGASAVLVSVSVASEPTAAGLALAALREAVDPHVAVVVGGAGAQPSPGTVALTDLPSLVRWATGS